MLSTRLIARCPSARLIGTALARDHALEFSKKSRDGSGKATLVRQPGRATTPGVVYEIATAERDDLDRYEFAGEAAVASGMGYERTDDFKVEMQGEIIVTTTYIAPIRHADLVPFDWYLAVVVAGALEHRLEDEHVERLRTFCRMPDPDVTRTSRAAALEALLLHGHRDPMAVLQG